jgi:hypothetical protein
MKCNKILLRAALGQIMSAVTAYTANALPVLKRSILTLLALAILVIGVKAGPNGQSNFVPWAPKHDNGVKALVAEIVALQKEIAALQRQVNLIACNPALQLGPFVSVDPNPENGVVGPNIVYKGANIHIISGSGNTRKNDTSTGLGNLIIGYDEAPSNLVTGERSGNHNLVIGPNNKFSAKVSGGIVAGEFNSISREVHSILGGASNSVGGPNASILGGANNVVFFQFGTIVGGAENVSSGMGSTVLGGFNNTADGSFSVVVGGENNDNLGAGAVILGNTDLVIGPDQSRLVLGAVTAPVPVP